MANKSRSDKFTWKKGDVQIYGSESAFRKAGGKSVKGKSKSKKK